MLTLRFPSFDDLLTKILVFNLQYAFPTSDLHGQLYTEHFFSEEYFRIKRTPAKRVIPQIKYWPLHGPKMQVFGVLKGTPTERVIPQINAGHLTAQKHTIKILQGETN